MPSSERPDRVRHIIHGSDHYPPHVQQQIAEVTGIAVPGHVAYALARVKCEEQRIAPRSTPYLAALVAQVEATGDPVHGQGVEASPIPTLMSVAYSSASTTRRGELAEWIAQADEHRHVQAAVAQAFDLPDDPLLDRRRWGHAAALLAALIAAIRARGDLTGPFEEIGELIDAAGGEASEHPRVAWTAALIGIAAMHAVGSVRLMPDLGGDVPTATLDQDPGSN